MDFADALSLSAVMGLSVFKGVAIGAILHVILPMFKILVRDVDHRGQRVAYLGIFLGFVAGFLVNLF